MLNADERKDLEILLAKQCESRKLKVRDYCAKYVLSTFHLNKFQQNFTNGLRKGLGKLSRENADIKCNISYVTDLPDKTERGKFLGLDLHGTDLRVLLIDLIDELKLEVRSKIYEIPWDLLTDEGEKLFDCIVDYLTDFITIYRLNDFDLQLGFTLSHPLDHLSLQKSLLVRGVNCSRVVGKNVFELLNEALMRKENKRIKIVAILNDSTGTLMSCALENINCGIGLIIGTDFNVCYLEKVSEVRHWNSSIDDPTHVIINTELGAFGINGCLNFLRTNEDRYVDENSLNRGHHFFEKMVSGMYMGELVRLIILQLVKDKVLFDGYISDVLNTKYAFKTAFISEIESDVEGVYTNCKIILKQLRLNKQATDYDCENILYICRCISRRSAHLVSAAVACLIDKMNEQNVAVVVEGSVYRLHPHYHNLMVETIGELRNPQLSFEVILSEGGPAKGAAIVAAVTARKKK